MLSAAMASISLYACHPRPVNAYGKTFTMTWRFAPNKKAGQPGPYRPSHPASGARMDQWNFVWVAGVEPTNNAPERALRHAGIWRRISGGADSEAGSRFLARMLSVVATCRQQGRDVLDDLTSCFEANRKGHAIPSLLPIDQAEIQVA
jgi:hypothetical protein